MAPEGVESARQRGKTSVTVRARDRSQSRSRTSPRAGTLAALRRGAAELGPDLPVSTRHWPPRRVRPPGLRSPGAVGPGGQPPRPPGLPGRVARLRDRRGLDGALDAAPAAFHARADGPHPRAVPGPCGGAAEASGPPLPAGPRRPGGLPVRRDDALVPRALVPLAGGAWDSSCTTPCGSPAARGCGESGG